MANAVAGIGTIFERWSGADWQSIAEINAIEGPDMDREDIEVTSLDTATGYEDYIPGFIDGGEVVLNMHFTRIGYELMKQDFELDVLRNYRISLPDDSNTMISFEGLVIDLPISDQADAVIEADVSIQITGEVTVFGAESGSGITADTTVVTADTTLITADNDATI